MSDQAVTAANVRTTQTPSARWIAGVSLTAGQVVSKDTTNGQAILSDAAGTVDAKVVKGVAVNSAAAGQYVDIVAQDPALNPGFAATPGDLYILSATPGNFAASGDQATGMKNTFLGIGNDDGTINFNPIPGGTTV